MSEKDGVGSIDGIFSHLSTEELKNRLRYATITEDKLDMELLDQLMAELDKREPIHITMTPEEALKVFYTEYAGQESIYLDCAYEPHNQTNKTDYLVNTRKRPVPFRAALIAAVIVVFIIGTLVVAQAAGIDVFGAIARWTDEVFTFSSHDNIALSPNDDAAKDSPIESSVVSEYTVDSGYQTLGGVLKTYGINRQIIPTWIPDGFEQTELMISEFAGVVGISVDYFFGELYFSMQVNITENPHTAFEKTDADPEVLRINNTDYFLIENTVTNMVTWYIDGCECYIVGSLSKEDIKKMIDSIYE